MISLNNSLNTTVPFELLCAEKDYLEGVLSVAQESFPKQAIISAIKDSGWTDAPISLTAVQMRFLIQNLPQCALNPALAGSKYQNGEVATAIVESLVQRLQESLPNSRG